MNHDAPAAGRAGRRRFDPRARRVFAGLGLGLLLLAVGTARVLGGCPGVGVEAHSLPVGERFEIEAAQVEVVDGDTVRIEGRAVRFLGADTPESPSPYFRGDQEPHAGLASAFTQRQIDGATLLEVQLLPTRDRYNRLLGHVFVDGESLSLRLVRAGHAYSTVGRYGHNGFPELAEAIEQAAAEASPAFEEPARWRSHNRR